jgi:hypothetical protein
MPQQSTGIQNRYLFFKNREVLYIQMDTKCSFKKCKRPAEINYMGKDICDFHWEKLCESGFSENKMLSEIGLVRIDGKVAKIKRATQD